MSSTQAFLADTMSFETWLQWVLLPRVREIVAEEGEFPSSSQVAIRAAREFSGYAEADRLIDLLSEFDSLFGSIDPLVEQE